MSTANKGNITTWTEAAGSLARGQCETLTRISSSVRLMHNLCLTSFYVYTVTKGSEISTSAFSMGSVAIGQEWYIYTEWFKRGLLAMGLSMLLENQQFVSF
ncbi:hypothetical protein QOT17_000379 [Balamuthia mandrillaris]